MTEPSVPPFKDIEYISLDLKAQGYSATFSPLRHPKITPFHSMREHMFGNECDTLYKIKGNLSTVAQCL